MQQTTNYNLNKPEGTDYIDIGDLNHNADVIDAELKAINEKMEGIEGAFKGHNLDQMSENILNLLIARELEGLSTSMDVGYWWDTLSDESKISSKLNATVDTSQRKATLNSDTGELLFKKEDLGFLSNKVRIFCTRSNTNNYAAISQLANIGDSSITIEAAAITISE